MRNAFRFVALSLVAALMLGGPIAPLASAQHAQPDVFRETMKGGPHEVHPGDVEFNETGYNVAAGVATAFLAPGRAITCAVGSAAGVAVLAMTFGSGYRWFARILEEGCGGKWIVRGEDLMPDRPGIVHPGESR